jgi:hypothetical protein
MQAQRLLSRGLRERPELQLKRLALACPFRPVGDDKPVREDGLKLQHPEASLVEERRVVAQLPHAPMEGRGQAQVEVEQLLLAKRLQLEVLWREQHAFVPLHGGGQIISVTHGLSPHAESLAVHFFPAS